MSGLLHINEEATFGCAAERILKLLDLPENGGDSFEPNL